MAAHKKESTPKPGLDRRTVLAALAGGAVLGPLAGAGEAVAAPGKRGGQVNVVIPRNYNPMAGTSRQALRSKLSKATLGFVHKAYRGRTMPIWGKRPNAVDLEKRVYNLTYWVLRGIEEHGRIYPVDPAWVMAQMLAESFFYEFAISWAFAVGPCQFIPETAKRYGMRVAGGSPKASLKFAKAELAGRHGDYVALRQEWRALRNKNRRFRDDEVVGELIQAVIEGRDVRDAEAYLAYQQDLARLDSELDQARDDYTEYLKANFEGRDIFRKADITFLRSFDERVTYKKPCSAMVKMLAQGLKARNGNMLAAAAAYNAGLGRTSAPGCYQPYGRIPAIEETVTYISRIVVNHHEIVRHMG
jgi:hypothetical protein